MSKVKETMRKSLGRGAAMGSKAQEMLGLGGSKSGGTLQIQRQGFLQKKPFTKSRSLRGSSWQKRYFVLKDSFLFWYGSKPKDAFDCNPQGCLPLGGCSVFPMGKEKDGGFVFEVSHPDFNGSVLQLKSKDKAEVDDWIRVLQDCSKATWQNAMLGDALIQKLKHEGTALEKEKDSALNQARSQAEQYDELRKEKLNLMEAQLDTQQRMESELLREKEAAQALQRKVKTKDEALERERREQEEEKERTQRMQKKLEEAYKAIKQLESALERRQRTDLEGLARDPERDAQLQDHIDTIKQFMDNR